MVNENGGGSGGSVGAGRPIPSADRILVKLRNMIANQQYYEAHQLYRTLYFRYRNWGKFRELQELLFEGAILFLNKEQFNSGSDLSSLFLDSLDTDPLVQQILTSPKDRNELYRRIGELFARIPTGTPERMTYAINALKLDASKFDVSLIHHNLAIVLFQEKNFPEARYHFLHAGPSSGPECAQMLIEYQVSSASSSEIDLFIVQFVLQVLCLKNGPIRVPDGQQSYDTIRLPAQESADHRSPQEQLATLTLRFYVEKHPRIGGTSPPFKYPLINFVWLLLIALPAGQLHVFRLLCDLYAVSLNRDPEFRKYLRRIGENYFGLPVEQNRPQGLFGNLLQSLFAAEDEDDSLDSVTSNQAPGNPVAAAAAAPSVGSRISRAVRSHQVEDLD